MALGKKKYIPKNTKKPALTVIIKGKDFSDKLKKFIGLKTEIKTKTVEQKDIESDIKSLSLDKYIELYNTMRKNPDSIKIQSEKGDKLLFVVSKRYAGDVDEERATELIEKYDDNIIDKKTDIVLNHKLLDKYSKQLEELIMNSEFMSEEEKDELFINKTTYSINKDAIDKAFDINNNINESDELFENNDPVKELINDIKPVVMLKDTK